MSLWLLMLCIHAMIVLFLIVARVRLRILSVSGENIMIVRRLCCACCRVLLCQEPAAPAKDAKEEDPAAEAKDLPEGMGWPSHPGNRHALSTAFQRGEQIWVWLPYISWPDDELRWITCFIKSHKITYFDILKYNDSSYKSECWSSPLTWR